jgi:hypothetical protein
MGHLLKCNLQDSFTPAFNHISLFLRQSGLACSLHAEDGVKVGAKQIVLDLGSFCERVDQLLSSFDRSCS